MANQGGWPPNNDPYAQQVGGPPGGSFGAPGYGAYGMAPYGQQGYGPPQGFAQGGSASSRAVTALVLAILSWVACSIFTGIPAFILARSELASIERGEAPMAGKGMAQAAYWIGIINTVMFGLVIVVYGVIFAFLLAAH